MSDKDVYRQFSESCRSVPLFNRAWWLDATAGTEGWDVALVRSGGDVVAALPYVLRRRYGLTISDHPPLTQTLGPWLRHGEGNVSTQLEREKKLMFDLIDQLPRIDFFSQRWSHRTTNWLPFHWRGFSQTTRYTYRLEDVSGLEEVWGQFSGRLRTEIRKAESRHHLQVKTDGTVAEIFKLVRQTFRHQGADVPYAEGVLEAIDAACTARGRGMTLIAHDDSGRNHAGAYLAWDDQTMYYLVGGGDPEVRNSGASSLCLWAAIQQASRTSHAFDFEGSMLEPVERFFRSFGAAQVPYHSVTRTRTRWQQSLLDLRRLGTAGSAGRSSSVQRASKEG